jgi:hypothetical protein
MSRDEAPAFYWHSFLLKEKTRAGKNLTISPEAFKIERQEVKEFPVRSLEFGVKGNRRIVLNSRHFRHSEL